MNRATIFVSALLGAAILVGGVRAQPSRTIWDGVYTDAQAKRGEAIYFETCVRCHGPQLQGGNDGAGPLTGPTFNGNWNGVPLGQMVDRMRATMPLDKPNTLTRQQTADVLTFILSMNKVPAGKTELPRQVDLLNTITFKTTK
jgi:mono/diheme cytochrome c family protein